MVGKRTRKMAARFQELAESEAEEARRLRELGLETQEPDAEESNEPPTGEVPAWPEQPKEGSGAGEAPGQAPTGPDGLQ